MRDSGAGHRFCIKSGLVQKDSNRVVKSRMLEKKVSAELDLSEYEKVRIVYSYPVLCKKMQLL